MIFSLTKEFVREGISLASYPGPTAGLGTRLVLAILLLLDFAYNIGNDYPATWHVHAIGH